MVDSKAPLVALSAPCSSRAMTRNMSRDATAHVSGVRPLSSRPLTISLMPSEPSVISADWRRSCTLR